MMAFRPGPMLPWALLAVPVVVLDQVTKRLALEFLVLHQPVPVLPGFNLTLMFNPGAAFSFLSDASGWQRWFFTAVALVVSVAIMVWLQRLPAGSRWLAAALALILGGALGNLWDRLALGHVVDFIQIYYDRWSWPAFNLADSAITVGAVMLVIDALGARHRGQA